MFCVNKIISWKNNSYLGRSMNSTEHGKVFLRVLYLKKVRRGLTENILLLQ